MGRAEKANTMSTWRQKHNPIQIPYPDINKVTFIRKEIEESFLDKLISSIINWVTHVRKG